MPDHDDAPTPTTSATTTPAPRSRKKLREITLSSVVFGVVVGAMMNASITYAGLKIGFTIVGSAIAAVLGFGVLRGILRKGSILETNIGQTIASAVNTPNAGVIFTVPVLLLLGYKLTLDGADFWLLTAACVAGAVLGCAFIIPLRKQMIDIDRLRFPEGTAVGAILKSPGAGAKKALVLFFGIVVGAVLFAPAALPGIQTAAHLDQLDALVAAGKIADDDAAHTRTIASWIDAKAAPTAIITRGGAVAQMRDARAKFDVQRKRAGARPDDAQVQSALAEAKSTFVGAEALTEQATLTGDLAWVSDDLARSAFRASKNERKWSSLKNRKLGWAGKPLWGYSDLDVRLSAETVNTQPTDPFLDCDSDGVNDPQRLSLRSDRDHDCKPDLIIRDDRINVGRWLSEFFQFPPEILFVFAITPLSFGAGYLSGKPGLLVLAGGVLAYFVLNPFLFQMGFMPPTISAENAPGFGFTNFNRPIGIGLLLGGAMMGVVSSFPAIREALKSIAFAGKSKGGSDELGLKVLVLAAIGAIALLYFASNLMEGRPLNLRDPVTNTEISSDAQPITTRHEGVLLAFENEDTLSQWNAWTPDARQQYMRGTLHAKPGLLSSLNPTAKSAIIALIGALWIWFAGIIIAQCTGMTDWSPISGMALLTIVLVMFLAGTGDVLGAVLVGAALCVAISCAADMMADLKTGYLVGGVPKRQQTVELLSAGIGPLISMATILLISQVNLQKLGVPMGPGTETTAPQAQALQAVITGVQGGEMPYALYGFGALLGVLLGIGSFAGLGVLVGLSMYLPIIYILTYGLGCLLNMFVTKAKGRRWSEEWGVPLAAGLIVGEAMLALITNFVILLMG